MARFLSVVSLGLVLLIQFAAWAGAPARPQTAKQAMDSWDPQAVKTEKTYVGGVFTSYVGHATKYMNKWVQAETETRTEEARAKRAESEKARGERDKKEAALNAELARADEALAVKRRELEKVGLRVDSLRNDLQAGVLSDSDQAKLTDLEKRQAELSLQIKAEEPGLAALRGGLSDQGRHADVNGTAKTFKAAEEELESALNGELRTRFQNEGFDRGVNEMFFRMRQTEFDAKTLLTDFDVLKTKHQLNDSQIQILKQGFEKRMHDNLLGNWVNNQIAKAMQNICTLKDKCSASGPAVADGLHKNVMEILEAGKLKFGDDTSPTKVESAK